MNDFRVGVFVVFVCGAVACADGGTHGAGSSPEQGVATPMGTSQVPAGMAGSGSDASDAMASTPPGDTPAMAPGLESMAPAPSMMDMMPLAGGMAPAPGMMMPLAGGMAPAPSMPGMDMMPDACRGMSADSDADGVPDCMDGCPEDAASAPPIGAECGSDEPNEGPDMPPASGGDECPPGFVSMLPLVLTGDAVPGNVELGLASDPETPRNPCGLPEEQECFRLINAEREASGVEPLLWDGDLADLARSHAADRSQKRYPGTQHGSSTNATHLYQQRAEFLGLKDGKFRSVVENATMGARSAQSAVGSWIRSSGHHAVLLGEGAWSQNKYAGCGGDGSHWNLELAF